MKGRIEALIAALNQILLSSVMAMRMFGRADCGLATAKEACERKKVIAIILKMIVNIAISPGKLGYYE